MLAIKAPAFLINYDTATPYPDLRRVLRSPFLFLRRVIVPYSPLLHCRFRVLNFSNDAKKLLKTGYFCYKTNDENATKYYR